MYRVAVTVFVEVPGSVETPLHLLNGIWRICKLTKEIKRLTLNAHLKEEHPMFEQMQYSTQLAFS